MMRLGHYPSRGLSDVELPPLLEPPVVAVVVPCFRVADTILRTLAGIGPEVSYIFVVDDACPDGSGALVSATCRDPRVSVLRHDRNQGVGGATITGYRAALQTDATIVVKLDGDGQADPALIAAIVNPISRGWADYVKGNRFFSPDDLVEMPRKRLVGNAMLSFMTKLSSGYWSVMDPNNGFTALSTRVLQLLPLHKISRRYFFESDMLFRLNTIRAVVQDLPMRASYGSEVSNLRIRHVWPSFLVGHANNTVRRIIYGYFLRGFSIASVELAMSLPLVLFGTVYGTREWIAHAALNIVTPAGTVMLAALPIILGVQFLLAFLSHDILAEPRVPLVRLIYRSVTPYDLDRAAFAEPVYPATDQVSLEPKT